MIADGAMSMRFDPSAFLREFGLSATIIVFTGWVIVSACKSIFPPIGAAIGRWIDAQTKQIEETTSVVRKIPDVIAQCFKETRDAIISFEKSVGASEGRIRDDFRASIDTMKEIVENDRLIRIEKNTEKIARKTIAATDPDTDPTSPIPAPHKK